MDSVLYPPGGNFLLNLGTGTDETPLDIIGESSYRFFLFPNIWAIGLACFIVFFQVALFYILWKDTKDLASSGGESRPGSDSAVGLHLELRPGRISSRGPAL